MAPSKSGSSPSLSSGGPSRDHLDRRSCGHRRVPPATEKPKPRAAPARPAVGEETRLRGSPANCRPAGTAPRRRLDQWQPDGAAAPPICWPGRREGGAHSSVALWSAAGRESPRSGAPEPELELRRRLRGAESDGERSRGVGLRDGRASERAEGSVSEACSRGNREAGAEAAFAHPKPREGPAGPKPRRGGPFGAPQSLPGAPLTSPPWRRRRPGTLRRGVGRARCSPGTRAARGGAGGGGGGGGRQPAEAPRRGRARGRAARRRRGAGPAP